MFNANFGTSLLSAIWHYPASLASCLLPWVSLSPVALSPSLGAVWGKPHLQLQETLNLLDWILFFFHCPCGTTSFSATEAGCCFCGSLQVTIRCCRPSSAVTRPAILSALLPPPVHSQMSSLGGKFRGCPGYKQAMPGWRPRLWGCSRAGGSAVGVCGAQRRGLNGDLTPP